VTAVDSTETLGLLRSVGADHTIDYTQKVIAFPVERTAPRLSFCGLKLARMTSVASTPVFGVNRNTIKPIKENSC